MPVGSLNIFQQLSDDPELVHTNAAIGQRIISIRISRRTKRKGAVTTILNADDCDRWKKTYLRKKPRSS